MSFQRVTRARATQLLADAKAKRWPVTMARLEILAMLRYSGGGISYHAIRSAVQVAHGMVHGVAVSVKQKPIERETLNKLALEILESDPEIRAPELMERLREWGPIDNAPAAFGPWISGLRALLGIRLSSGRPKLSDAAA